MEWKDISKERIQREADGFFVIKPKNVKESIPLFCPVCNVAMRNSLDVQYYRKWGACYECGTMHAELNREKWQAGWRPELSKPNE
jgi:hypothetical protein